MTLEKDLKSIEIIQGLPDYFHPGRGDSFPIELKGAEIVNIGSAKERGILEGGGLIIDYKKSGDTKISRIIFSFNEAGMWVEYNGPVGK